MHYAKSVCLLFIIILFGYGILKQENTSLDSLRTQAQEARQGEIRAREAREAREDNLSKALYDQCYSQSLTATGINFNQKQRKSYECWREKINHTNDINCPELYESGGKIESPREGVTFIFTKKEAKELYPNCIIGTGTVTSANSEVPPKGQSITPTTASPATSESIKKVQSLSKPVPSVKKKEAVQSSEKSNQSSSGISHNSKFEQKKSNISTTSVVLVGKKLEPKKENIQSATSANPTISKTKKCPQKTILRRGWNDPRVQYAYNISCGDMDFIKTIEAESKWHTEAVGDSGKSFGLCQIHKGFNPAMQKAYRALKTDNEKVAFCYKQYSDWVKRGVIKTRLYGYGVRNLPQNKNSFTFLQK